MGEITELSFSMPLSVALAGRTSVRDFTPDVISKSQVDSLLHAAVRAPTAMHRETWCFVVLQDKALMRRISDRAKRLFSAQLKRLHHGGPGQGANPLEDPEANVFYNAGTLIVVCAPRDAPFAQADAWLAAQNIVLAAYAGGLGTCVIGSSVAALELPEVRAELQVPVETAVVAPIIVGVPAHAGTPSERSEPRVLSWV
jgi:nitroreductase